MTNSEPRGINKLTLGMILLALGGLFLGMSLGYFGTNMYLSDRVLKDMKSEGYVLTDDATATENDILTGKTAYVNGRMITGVKEVLDTDDATADSDKIVKGKTGYVNGQIVIGTLDLIQAQELLPTTSALTIDAKAYLAGDIVILGDPNLVAENIKNNIQIFGVNGRYVPGTEE